MKNNQNVTTNLVAITLVLLFIGGSSHAQPTNKPTTGDVVAPVQEIPAQFRGEWDQTKKSCVAKLAPNGFSDSGLTVNASVVVVGMETSCTLQKGAKYDGKELTATYKCMSEGESSNDNFKLVLLDSNRIELKGANGGNKYIKCGK